MDAFEPQSKSSAAPRWHARRLTMPTMAAPSPRNTSRHPWARTASA